MPTFNLVTKAATHAFETTLAGDAVRIPGLVEALGYELKPEGLCQAEVCVPLAGQALRTGDGDSLRVFAGLTGRPLALDVEERAAALGESAAVRRGSFEDTLAPDFTLPDLSGELHSLSRHRGRKVLLAAWASW